MAEEISDIQEDFCIQLDEYPVITKFSTVEDYKQQTFFNDFSVLFYGSQYFHFRIELDNDRELNITPLFLLNPPFGKTSKEPYENRLSLYSNYISFQLKNSGILPKLIELIQLKNQLSIALRVIKNPKPDFSVINFHKDQSFFTFLQYYNFSQPFVFGTEVLLGYKEDESLLPHQLSEILPLPEKVGTLSDVYKTINDVNSELNDNAVVLRGKYNNGDTMVFADTLIRHATITSNEVIESNGIKISIPKKGEIRSLNIKTDNVRICSERVPTTREMVSNRQAISMFIYLDTDDYTNKPAENFETSFKIEITDEKVLKTVNFNKDKFKEFVTSLSMGDGCITIDGLNIKSRGGKRRRNTKKNKKDRKSRRRKRLTR
jgi:hypothetical protein